MAPDLATVITFLKVNQLEGQLADWFHFSPYCNPVKANSGSKAPLKWTLVGIVLKVKIMTS